MRLNLEEFYLLKKKLKPGTQVQIVSGSMEPWIRVGEKITVSLVKIEELKPFDIIIYWDSINQILICHIFICLRDDSIICKPLNFNKEDKPVDISYLLAKVDRPKFRWFHKILLKLFYR